ncbi:YbaB/EbfC family nucleoid-associated protein [Streptomyces sp. NPDC008121]|uniref:YbaB/EbfC family nucleoid-associated protein n=1 Tax=Streptomyces sp. NPDC008121 TaxID=3364809 RepID=UPI0036EEA528
MASVYDSPPSRLLQALSGMQRLQVELRSVQHQMSCREFVATSAGGAVVARVNGLIGLTDLRINRAAVSDAALSQEILSAIRKASTAATAAHSELLAPIHRELAELQRTALSLGV